MWRTDPSAMLRVLQTPYIRALKFVHKIPIVNNMKGRVTLIALLLALTSAVSASAASGAVRLNAHSYCGSRCGQVAAVHGAGKLQQWGTGVTYGTVGQGTIAIRDRSNNGHRDFSVGGWDHRWTKDDFVYYSGRGMSYQASTTWTVKITAAWGASTTTTAVGRGYIQGATKNNAWLETHWTLGSGLSPSQWPHWPTAGKSFSIGR